MITAPLPTALVTVIVVAVAAQSAQAFTLELDPQSAPDTAALIRDQKRIDRTLLPWPDQALPVIYADPPCGGYAMACAGVGGSVSLHPGATRHALIHEAAHAAVDSYLTDSERADWTGLMRDSGMLDPTITEWWDWGKTNPAELFADAWADCATRRRPTDPGWHPTGGYGYNPSAAARPQVCAWLYHVAHSKGWSGGESPEQRAAAIAVNEKRRFCVRLKRKLKPRWRQQYRRRCRA